MHMHIVHFVGISRALLKNSQDSQELYMWVILWNHMQDQSADACTAKDSLILI